MSKADLALGHLLDHEAVIERGVTSMLEMAGAFEAIRDGREYKAAGFSNFEDYCTERWGLSRTQVDRVILGAQTARELTPIGVTPTHESQVRPLRALPDPEERAEAWEEAVEEAGGQPTAKQVERAVHRRSEPPSAPPESEPQPAPKQKCEHCWFHCPSGKYRDELQEEFDAQDER